MKYTALLLTASLIAAPHLTERGPITMKKLTPIIVVDAIEPCLSFWTDQLGFELTATVPHGDAIGFAMMQRGGVELMYQNRASVDADMGASGDNSGLGGELTNSTVTVFIEVDDLDSVIDALVDPEIIVPRRQTFYGMDELFVRAPCGTLVGFAARVEGGEEG